MGGGIAMCCAEAGMRVVLLEISQQALDNGMSVIKKNYARSVERKSKTQAQVDGLVGSITPTLRYEDFGACDLVVEAVFENMKIKQEIFAQFDKVCKPGCVLASNTSGLDVDAIASATKRPEDVIGCHFFSPANVMKLLENVKGTKSSPRTVATAMAFGKKLKKVTCLVGNCPGFIANRVMGVSGATKLLHSGVMPHEIDAAAEKVYGMRMGPFRMNDLVGIDLYGRERQRSGVADPTKVVGDAMFARNRYGQKTGSGFYKYDPKTRAMSRDPEAEAIIEEVWRNVGASRRSISPEQIIQELYFPVINEGFKCLEEGMAIRPSDIDCTLVFGYSWPRYRGGPMQYATAVGLPNVLAGLEKMKVKPSDLLVECVRNGWGLNSKGFNARLKQLAKL
jgi:3-hydroxyacyl-CoA dehydrogenase